MGFRRYAFYYVPPEGEAWARFCTGWLGWDMAEGRAVAHPVIAGLGVAAMSETPRRYGLHATIKPPFRLAEGQDRVALETACEALCARMAPVELGGLALAALGRFLALRPTGGGEAVLTKLAAGCVRGLDQFRAPPTPKESARWRMARLTPAQRANLNLWGYPYVMEAFRFHITLTGRLDAGGMSAAIAALSPRLSPLLPAPLRIDALSLAGEDGDGRFHLLRRFALSG